MTTQRVRLRRQRSPRSAPAGAAPPAERRVRLRQVTEDGALTVFGSAVGSLGLTWVLYERVLAFSGVLGFWLSWYVIFLLMYCAMAAAAVGPARGRADRVASVAFGTGGLLDLRRSSSSRSST